MPASKSSRKPNPGCGMVTGGKFSPHNLLKTNPLREQFAPTPAQPIRQRARMGGDPAPEDEGGLGRLARTLREVNTKPVQAASKQRSDRELHNARLAGDKTAGPELIRRINSEVVFDEK